MLEYTLTDKIRNHKAEKSYTCLGLKSVVVDLKDKGIMLVFLIQGPINYFHSAWITYINLQNNLLNVSQKENKLEARKSE